MDGQQLSPQQLIECLRQEIDQTLAQVADAVNNAPEGHVIRGSEHQVKDLMDRLRSRVFQQALQMKADAVEASFSPGGGGDRSAAAQQGTIGAVEADGVRLDGTVPPAVAGERWVKRGRAGRRGIGRDGGGDQRGGQ